ncbi:Sodium/calcium exchanger protein-domain-containing protein [Podospora aff. communis PSN243]|uniref:Sodium/calcium exchanger protein-domain-containing protein n=1 Tax=Podospora aff. communis PSN243 TaxID=3040156 RepID=A0AAV9H1W6_9PEZI|nr:Sodium/calcium exchanger protein-domain-containing protein [Podospora aff. communis PSN243]
MEGRDRAGGLGHASDTPPFVAWVFLISILATYALVIRPALFESRPYDDFTRTHKDIARRHEDAARPYEDLARPFEDARRVSPSAKAPQECRAVHQATDQCAFILANCEDDDNAGLLHYLSFYYCTLGNAKPVAFAILVVWTGLLFTTIGIAAAEYFSINLSTLSRLLNLSENLAGVTLCAIGNGSPDVFSTFAAMSSNSGSMAIGELIGAAGFITAVVAGSMGLVREFKVSKKAFVRDILFFIVAISFTMVFLNDGELHLWECFTMIGFYLTYVAVVVGWHWYVVRRRKQRQRQIASRSHLIGASGTGSDEIEPYRDFPEDGDGPMDRRSASAPEPADISALERGPRIEIDGEGVTNGADDDDEGRERHAIAEMTSNMSINRPRWRRSNTAIAPIRPSLVGALEFRSVLASLQRASNMPLGRLPERMYSDHARQLSGALERSATGYQDVPGRSRAYTSLEESPAAKRDRALSHGNIPLNLGGNLGSDLPEIVSEEPSPGLGRSTSATIDGRLAPPSPIIAGGDHAAAHQPRTLSPSRRSDRPPQLRIPSPSRGSSIRSSPSLSPFPGLTESPGALTPLPPNEDPTVFTFQVPPERRLSTAARPLEDDEGQPKPVKWWPYGVLPPPHILLNTLFPTLQGWKDKPWWGKIVSAILLPTVFVLVTTLPVAHSEATELPGDDLPDIPEAIQSASPSSPNPGQRHDDEQREAAAWQEFRRRTRSVSSRSPRALSTHHEYLDDHESENGAAPGRYSHRPSISVSVPQLAHPNPDQELDDATTETGEEEVGWKRWLIAVQIFTGPLFVVFITWANIYSDEENPGRALLKLVAYSLIFSLCLLAALLLFTTPDKKPKYHHLLCFLGFMVSIAWISTIAGEVVGVLKAFGVILGISEAILGLTVFAVGNSLGDLVADITIARLDHPVMALAACFGGPMLNILLGIGFGGVYMAYTSANKAHRKHPDRPLHYKPYQIQVGTTLKISAAGVLFTLFAILIAVPCNNWVMNRRIGFGLIAIWTFTTLVNVIVEVSSNWSDVA